ncbi:MAG TPA: site-specific DNA-methyltransferase, partial [Anaerolineales bacterium]|nr:site-specific DNA-methyltransferase [Anaerolineales bacterium]
MTLPEKLDLTSHNLPADKTAELLRLFPEIRTEGDKIDFDKLKLVLGQTVDAGRERYGMTWPGKADCFKTIQAPSTGTLLPAPDESVDFDTTENLIIEGDNLNVLKLLQKAYLSKVKMIYIDPPYNTGNDFIYPDNYAESLQTYLEYTGQVDAEGRKFGTNTDTDGRFHSRWLNMMYPRLYLARNLLRDDGVVFISIDDNEVDNLRKLCNEIFGEECWLATIVWQNSSRNSDQIAIEHEYLHVYAKTPSANGTSWNRTRDIALNLEKKIQEYKHQGMAKEDAEKELSAEIDLLLEEDEHRGDKTNAWLTNYKNIDDDWNIYYPVDLSGEGNGPPRRFGDKEVPAPPGRHWMSQEYIDELLTQNRIAWRGDRAYRKLYIQESLENLKSVIRIPTRNGSETLKQILGKDVFDKPKPHNL